MLENFQIAHCAEPVIHEGDFKFAVPDGLPEQSSVVHIDCGFGGDVQQHKGAVLHLLEHLYPRIPRGALGVLMDYHDPTLCDGVNHNPGVKLATDEFFANRPEKVGSL